MNFYKQPHFPKIVFFLILLFVHNTQQELENRIEYCLIQRSHANFPNMVGKQMHMVCKQMHWVCNYSLYLYTSLEWEHYNQCEIQTLTITNTVHKVYKIIETTNIVTAHFVNV